MKKLFLIAILISLTGTTFAQDLRTWQINTGSNNYPDFVAYHNGIFYLYAGDGTIFPINPGASQGGNPLGGGISVTSLSKPVQVQGYSINARGENVLLEEGNAGSYNDSIILVNSNGARIDGWEHIGPLIEGNTNPAPEYNMLATDSANRVYLAMGINQSGSKQVQIYNRGGGDTIRTLNVDGNAMSIAIEEDDQSVWVISLNSGGNNENALFHFAAFPDCSPLGFWNVNSPIGDLPGTQVSLFSDRYSSWGQVAADSQRVEIIQGWGNGDIYTRAIDLFRDSLLLNCFLTHTAQRTNTNLRLLRGLCMHGDTMLFIDVDPSSLPSPSYKFLTFVTNTAFCDGLVPAPPSNLKLTQSGNGFLLSWTGTSNEYILYKRYSQGSYNFTVPLKTTSTTQYQDNAVSAGIAYCYIVGAVNSNGDESNNSNEACGQLAKEVVQPPSKLTLTSEPNNNILNWQESSTPNVYYRLYRTLTSGTKYVLIKDKITGTTYTDASLINGKQYFYVVSAYDPNASLESANSNEVSGIPLAANSGWADMRASLYSSESSISAGVASVISYDITYENRGTADAKNVEIIAPIPTNTTYESGSAVPSTTLWYTMSGDVFGGSVQWTQTMPPVSLITGLKWAFSDYPPDCKACSSDVSFKVDVAATVPCGITIDEKVQISDGVNAGDIMQTEPFATSVSCVTDLQIDKITYSPNPIVYGQDFTVILTISNHGPNATTAYANLSLNIWSDYPNLVTGDDQWIPIAATHWLDESQHTSGDDPGDISIPTLQTGGSWTITLQHMQFISTGLPWQANQTISPNRTVHYRLSNLGFETDPSKITAIINLTPQTMDIKPSQDDFINCGMELLTVLTSGGDAVIDAATGAAKCATNMILGVRSFWIAVNSGNNNSVADASAKLMTSFFECVLDPKFYEQTILAFLSDIITFWDGTWGCSRAIQYDLLYAYNLVIGQFDRSSVQSPVYVSVKNPNGQISGWLPSDSVVAQMPNSAMWKDSASSDANFIFPIRDTLDFQLYGYDTGAFTFDVGISLDSAHLLKITFQDSSTRGMYAYFHYRKGVTPYVLEIYRNGDTVIDTIPATLVEIIVDTTSKADVQNERGSVNISALNVYPNPVSGLETLLYSLGNESSVSITIYDLLGRVVASPVVGEMEGAGQHETTFDTQNLPPGLYTCRLSAGDAEMFAKMVVVR